MSFIVHALPRSRTYWLSKYLTYREWYCGHDQVVNLRTMDDITSWLSLPCTGTVETSAMPFWRLVPDIPTVTIRRPVDAVIASMRQFPLQVDWDLFTAIIRKLDRKLDQIEKRVPNTLRVTFDELQHEDACRAIWEHCLPYPFDPAWWQAIAPINLQTHMPHTIRHYAAHEPQLTKLAKVLKHKIIAGMSRKLTDVLHEDGFTFQEETVASTLTDAQRLFADHCVLVGETPDSFWSKNIGLFKRLEDNGCLQVMTARENGRMYGYLVSLVTPSLESPDLKIATQTMFFVDPSRKGLGMRLQRAAVEQLRMKGVDEAYFHAGVRGSGPKMGTLYRRIGAKPFGEWFKLDL